MNNHLNRIQNWDELAHNAGWSVACVAKNCGVSIRTLERFFLQSKGKPPKIWFNEKRQERAMKLLLASYSVKEAADCLGYSYASTFSREFAKHWGFSPVTIKPDSSALLQGFGA